MLSIIPRRRHSTCPVGVSEEEGLGFSGVEQVGLVDVLLQFGGNPLVFLVLQNSPESSVLRVSSYCQQLLFDPQIARGTWFRE